MNTVGQRFARPDGRIKVTGAARYTADFDRPDKLHAVLVTAPAAGQLTSLDTEEAAHGPGVIRILTQADLPQFTAVPVPLMFSLPPMRNDTIRFEGQPVAMVLAETLEQAEAAAHRVRVTIAPAEVKSPGQSNPRPPVSDSGYIFAAVDAAKGDLAAGFSQATHRIAAEYAQPSRHHNAMEPHATLAWWEGEDLVVHDATQWTAGTRQMLAKALGLPPERVRVMCPHTGGGFGSKAFPKWHTLFAAAAARVSGRPVKLVLSRAQMYTMTGYQPLTRHRIELGATPDGGLTALHYDSVNVTSSTEDFVESATQAGRAMYAVPALETHERVEEITAGAPTPLRAPGGGASGMWALESAMDELAYTLGMDPLELRLRNHAEVDPVSGKPWSSKNLLEAYALGAERFGWHRRPAQAERDGDWMVGWGMASATMGSFRLPAAARVSLRADGTALLESSFNDIGTGVFTIFSQLVGDALGLPPDRVEIRNGDSTLPEACGTFCSASAMCVGAALLDACRQIRASLGEGDPLALLRWSGRESEAALGRFSPGEGVQLEIDGGASPNAMRTWGAVFVEVGVDRALGLLRLRRMLGSYSVGRVLNPRTTKSQLIGAMIWGWGMAAMEASIFEPRLGRFLSKNLVGVPLPVNADIPAVDAVWVDEFDEVASPIGGKGVGEIGVVGVAPAVANAVFHATGLRIRELPILPEKLLAKE
ncbi:xanthine dehydrogenase family protein molybdopterin-binding subunit [Xanthobacter sp. VTT E-85241]|uniref:xanthine dehydrogenase family protein molybdopterin-binding subunit n=1 Tax=Roseixanthobacter finlandensis TaxID=3119922 RepID=UPI0037276481